MQMLPGAGRMYLCLLLNTCLKQTSNAILPRTHTIHDQLKHHFAQQGGSQQTLNNPA